MSGSVKWPQPSGDLDCVGSLSLLNFTRLDLTQHLNLVDGRNKSHLYHGSRRAWKSFSVNFVQKWHALKWSGYVVEGITNSREIWSVRMWILYCAYLRQLIFENHTAIGFPLSRSLRLAHFGSTALKNSVSSILWCWREEAMKCHFLLACAGVSFKLEGCSKKLVTFFSCWHNKYKIFYACFLHIWSLSAKDGAPTFSSLKSTLQCDCHRTSQVSMELWFEPLDLEMYTA